MLYRTYDTKGVNGELFYNGERLCYTIELPWLNNQPNRSCIPEGSYVLKKRWSKKHGWHIEVTGVRGRSLILFHPANDAQKELRGCIAPVTKIVGWGRGDSSRAAFEKLRDLVYDGLTKSSVTITLTKNRH